jgi:hypothetical protein
VIRLGALGDVVRTRFAFAGVRALYPRRTSSGWSRTARQPRPVGLPGLDGRVEVPRRKLRARHPRLALATLREFAAELRARRYDLSIDFHGVFRSGFLAWAAQIPVRVGYGPPIAKESSHWFQTLRAPVRAAHMSRFERNTALVHFLGGGVPARPHVLELDGARACFAFARRFALIHRARAEDHKRWRRSARGGRAPHERAGRAWSRSAGRQARRPARSCGGDRRGALNPQPIAGRVPSLALSRDLFVGCDSAHHLATLAGTPVASSGRRTGRSALRRGPARIVRRDVGCNPAARLPARACRRSSPKL